MAPSLAPLFELRLLAMMLPCISELAQISMHWLLQGPRAVARPPANRAAPHLSHLVLGAVCVLVARLLRLLQHSSAGLHV